MARKTSQHAPEPAAAVAKAISFATGTPIPDGGDLLPPHLAKEYRAAKKLLVRKPTRKKSVK